MLRIKQRGTQIEISDKSGKAREFPLLIGQRIFLNAITLEDIPIIRSWYEDPSFWRLTSTTHIVPPNDQAIVEDLIRKNQDHTRISFAFRRINNEELIGIGGYTDIEWSNQNGELYTAIGDPANRGCGYGTESLKLMLSYAFNELNLYRIYLTVVSYNKAAINLYKKAGFKLEGTSREHGARDGSRYDLLHYGLLRKEWR